ncbi:MAG: DNA mismatch repair endonuclease MutL [Clostridia bacterium]|nr:DNA mismatch repair endonuclease MutL [Clostridia bacterium]
MPEIRLLDSSVINLIAAGEVVDRPASAVKEMVENAIDAGAKHITVEIRRGGLELIRITDDGCGMTADNARRAFLKHATSKITDREDLNRISTLGFRGEALAAISAVSKISLTTKPADQTVGVRFEVEAGEILSEEECGCPDGSVFFVRNLFYNTPARLKFMKSEPAEAGAVQSVMERLALSHPDISFRFISNGTDRLHTTGSGNLTEAVFSVFGREFAEMSLSADHTSGDVRVWGLIGKPVYSKANRNRQIFFLNGRFVRSPILSAGFENAYHNRMLIGRAPVCVLFVEMPTENVDVNVHPGKLEVKFSDENGVAYAVRKAAETALSSDSGIVEINVPRPVPVVEPKPVVKPMPSVVKISVPEASPAPAKPIERPTPSVPPAKKAPIVREEPRVVPMEEVKPQPSTEKPAEFSGWTITPPVDASEIRVSDVVISAPIRTAPPPPPPVMPEVAPSVSKPAARVSRITVSDPVPAPVVSSESEPVLFQAEEEVRIVGEVFDCYILVEKGEDVLFIDKHALHERMNFEKLRKSDIPAQSLLHPIVLNIGIQENRILVEHADFLARFGFILESFAEDLLIREIPALIDPEDAEPLLQQFADSLALGKSDSLMDWFYYDLACKASIRSGSKTTRPELEGLVKEYFRRESELQYCPHGRPIVFSLSKKSIEKQFKRVK